MNSKISRKLKLTSFLAIFTLTGLGLWAAEKPPADTQAPHDPSEGDNLRTVASVAAIDIPLDDAPVKTVDVKSPDGIDLTFAWRHPQGNAVCPAIVFLHGGGQQAPLAKLRHNLLNGSVQTRFLDKGFAVVECTRRPFWKSPTRSDPSGFYDAVQDTALILEKVRTLPGVDPKRIALYGGSGGGILAIVTASQTDVTCVIAGEPAVVVPLAPDMGGRGGVESYRAVMDEPGKYFTGARKDEILAWMHKIACPVLVLQGKSVGLYKANFEVLIPEMRKLGKDISSMAWPEVRHGFYFGGQRSGATPELVDAIVKHSIEFINAAARSKDARQKQDSLKTAFADCFAIGGGIPGAELNPAERELLFHHFNTLTPENCMKPAPLQPAENRFDFAKADELVEMARAGGLTVNGHTLIWHNQCPNWFFVDGDQPAARDLVLKRMRDHITAVAKHFAGRVASWDVVNEAISDEKNTYLRKTHWLEHIGENYIAEAFLAARQADPTAELYYNDYGIERPVKREKALRLIRELKQLKIPIQGIGIQGHWQIDKIPFKDIEDAIIAFHAEGIQVMITELDVDMVPRTTQSAEASSREQGNQNPYVHGLTPEAQQKLADQYAALFALFLKHRDKITRVTFWGLHDGRSWLNHWPRGRTCTNHPLLWDRALQPKPAFSAVLEIAQQDHRRTQPLPTEK